MSRQYDILEHGMMLADRRRLDAYLAAIAEVVRPGDVVVDIGSGTGIFTLAACRAGARQVYAIEQGAVMEIARAVVAANGCVDRVTFIEARSDSVQLPELAAVLVMDVRGVLPDSQLPIACDARRLLRPGGRTVPAADEIWAAPVCAPALHGQQVGVWSADACGVDLTPARGIASDSWVKHRFTPDQLLAPPVRLGTIHYASRDASIFDARAEWQTTKASDGHGFAIWFESLLADGVRISNRPGEPALLYGQGYFPWLEPARMPASTMIALHFRGAAIDGDYEWGWRTELSGAHERTLFEQGITDTDVAMEES